MTTALEIVFWISLAALVWTHLAYPLAAWGWARLRPWPVAEAEILPTVSLIIPAYNEEAVIEAKLENALALDYPRELLEIVVTSDASTDRTHEIVAGYADRGVRLIHCPRGGKVAAQDRAVRETRGEIVAFGDANVIWDARLGATDGAPVRRPQGGHGLRLRAAGQPGRRHQPGRRVLALRDVAARHGSRRSTRSPDPTARSTRSAAMPTARSIPASATT